MNIATFYHRFASLKRYNAEMESKPSSTLGSKTARDRDYDNRDADWESAAGRDERRPDTLSMDESYPDSSKTNSPNSQQEPWK